MIERFNEFSAQGRVNADRFDKRTSGVGHGLTHFFYEKIAPAVALPFSYIGDVIFGQGHVPEKYFNPRWDETPRPTPVGVKQNSLGVDMSNVRINVTKGKQKTKKGRGKNFPGRRTGRKKKEVNIRINNMRSSDFKTPAGRKRFNRARRVIQKYPPVSYMKNVKSGFSASFHTGRVPGCMRMRVMFRIGQVQSGTVDASSSPLVSPLFSMNGGADMIIPVNPSFGYYFPPYITQLCRLFAYFYVNKVFIKISPRVNTSNVAVATLGYTGEPNWIENTHSYGSLSQAKIPETTISSLSNACTDVLYRPCTVYATNLDTERKYFMTGPIFNSALAFTSYSSDLRQSVAGMFMISGKVNTGDSDGVTYGDVYMGMDIELCQFGTPMTINATFERERQEEREKKIIVHEDFRDEFVISPVPSVKTKVSSRK